MFVSPYVTAVVVTAVLAGGFGVLAWRRRPEPGAASLAVLFGTVVLWSGWYGLALATTDPRTRLLLERLVWFGSASAPVAWIVFALQYTGHGERVTPRFVAGVSVPAAVAVALVWTNDFHHLVWRHTDVVLTQGVSVLSQSFGPAFWVYLVYAYGLVLAGVVLLLRVVFTADHLFVDQALALVFASLLPVGANVASVLGLAPVPGMDLTPYAFAVSSVGFGYALFHSQLLETSPATRRIGRTAAVRNMRDGVVVTDDEGRVVDLNPVAERLFDCRPASVVGSPVAELAPRDDVAIPAGEDTVVWSGEGPREYEVTVSAVTDQHDRPVGRVLVVRDITDRANRQQQLQVLNRVLRHDFRNDMNVIDVCATQLADRLSGENEELADRIRTVARDLAETGTKAREIERIMARRDNEPAAIDLPALVVRLLDTLRHEYPEARFETDLPDGLEIVSNGILESALENVLENAVRHNDSDEPLVAVTVRPVPGTDEVEVQVADNGPGIPEQERDVLVKGTESPLEHSSGLGLWLVNWGVTMLGGEVRFADNDPRGSIVTIRVPRRQDRVLTDRGPASAIDAD